jgi:hypothetical protein
MGVFDELQQKIPFLRYEEYPELFKSLASLKYKPDDAPKFWAILEELLRIRSHDTSKSNGDSLARFVCDITRICKSHRGSPLRITELINDIVRKVHESDKKDSIADYMQMHKQTMRSVRIEEHEKVLKHIMAALSQKDVTPFEYSLMLDILTTGSKIFPGTSTEYRKVLNALQRYQSKHWHIS